MDDYQSKLNSTFEQIAQAARDADKHVLGVHMWEHSDGAGMDKAALQARSKEMKEVLAPMAGDESVIYNDGRYFSGEGGYLPNREVKGSAKEGLVGIATTPVTDFTQMPAFNSFSNTGLLLMEPKPVLVHPHDGWTMLISHKEALPSQNTWQHLKTYISRAHRDDMDQFAHFNINDVPTMEKLLGKLTTLRVNVNHPLYSILKDQDAHPGSLVEGGPWVQVDPFAKDTQERAGAAYKNLMQQVKSGVYSYPLDEHDAYPEVDVNAKLENAAGIVAYNPSRSGEISGDQPWSENLEGNVQLAKTLFRAMKEQEQLQGTLREHGITRTPTIVVYQPQSSTHRVVHFPPTKQNKEIVEGVLSKHGIDVAALSQETQRQ